LGWRPGCTTAALPFTPEPHVNLEHYFSHFLFHIAVLNITVMVPGAASFVILTNLEKPADLRLGLLSCLAGATFAVDAFLAWNDARLLAAFFSVQAVVWLSYGALRLRNLMDGEAVS
jgi:hypothetical protein